MQVDIKADISKLKAAIKEAKGDIIDLKINGENVTIGGQNITREANQATGAVKDLNKELKQTGTSAKNSARQATSGLKAVTNQAKGAVGFVKNLAQSFVTPWTLAIVAVEAAVKAFKYFFNNLTESVDKMTARGQSAIKNAQRNIKMSEEQTRQAIQLIQKLEELNKIEELSYDQKAYGQSIVNRLNKEYKIFGITLDEVTGKYEGLYQEQMRLDAHNKEVQARGIRQQIQGQRQVVNAVMKEVFGGGLQLGKSINGTDLFTWAERIGGTLGADNAELLAKKWGNGTNLKAIRDIFQQLMDGLSDRENAAEIQKVIDAIDQLVDYNTQLSDLNSISKAAMDSAERLTKSFEDQRKAIKATTDQIANLKQQYEENEKQEKFNSLAPKEQIKALEDEVKAIEDRNNALKEAQTKNNYKVEFSKSFAAEREEMRKNNFAQQQSLKEQIEARTQQIEKLERAYSKAHRPIKDIEAELDEVQKLRHNPQQYGWAQRYDKQIKQLTEELNKAKKAQEQIQNARGLNTSDQNRINSLAEAAKQAEVDAKEYGDIALQAEQDVANADKELQQNLLKIQQIKGNIKTLTEQIADAEKRAAEEAQKATEALWQRETNAKKSIEDQLFEIQNKVLRKQGNQRQAIYRENIKKIEQQLGRPLQEMDRQFYNIAERMTDIQMASNALDQTNTVSPQSDKVYTNWLAQMGGFSSSVVVDRMDINKQILNTNKSSNQYLNNINNGIQDVRKNLQW